MNTSRDGTGIILLSHLNIVGAVRADSEETDHSDQPWRVFPSGPGGLLGFSVCSCGQGTLACPGCSILKRPSPVLTTPSPTLALALHKLRPTNCTVQSQRVHPRLPDLGRGEGQAWDPKREGGGGRECLGARTGIALALKTKRLRFGRAGKAHKAALQTPSPGHSLPGQDTRLPLRHSTATGKSGSWIWTRAKRLRCRQFLRATSWCKSSWEHAR